MSRAERTRRNSPQQQTIKDRPLYANDPTGFWERNAKANDEAWGKILPDAIIQIDLNVRAAILAKQISFSSIKVRWNDIEFDASIDDGQASAMLEIGGTGSTGQITLVFSKDDPKFRGEGWPSFNDEVQILVRGDWKLFAIKSISEGFDSTDSAVIAILEPEDSE